MAIIIGGGILPAVGERPLGLLDIGVELDEGVGPRGCAYPLTVQAVKLLRQVLEKAVSQLAVEVAFAQCQETHVLLDDVAGRNGYNKQ